MSIYIKGMKMPTSCAFCRFYGAYCYAKGDEDVHSTLPCPLVHVTQHGRLIDADALEQDVQKRLLICDKNDNQFQRPYEVMRAIALAPTIIPAEEE